MIKCPCEVSMFACHLSEGEPPLDARLIQVPGSLPPLSQRRDKAASFDDGWSNGRRPRARTSRPAAGARSSYPGHWRAGAASRSEAAHHAAPFWPKSFGNSAGDTIPISASTAADERQRQQSLGNLTRHHAQMEQQSPHWLQAKGFVHYDILFPPSNRRERLSICLLAVFKSIPKRCSNHVEYSAGLFHLSYMNPLCESPRLSWVLCLPGGAC